MFRRDLFSVLSRRSTIDVGHSKTPQPPPRDSDLNEQDTKDFGYPNDIDPNDIVFEPYVSSSSSSVSENEDTSEEVVSIDMDNLEELDLDTEHSIVTSPPLSPGIVDTSFEKYENIEYFGILKQTVLFGPIFSDEERDFILSNMSQVHYPPDSLLFSQGDLPSYLFVIVEGTVELIQTDVKGTSSSMQKLYTGSVIGEADIYNHSRYEYYCVTCEEVVVLRVSSSILYEIIEKNKRYDLYLRRSLCSRNWKQMMWINQILQGKEEKKHEEEAFENNPVQTRHLRKDPVHFTTDMFVNEDKDLHVCINQYKLIKEVSVGINSRIYVGFSEKDHQYYAIKSINKHMKSIKSNSKLYRFWGNNAIDSLRTEANILKDLNHPNIVQLEEVIVDNKMNDFILIEELIRGHIIMEEQTTSQQPVPMMKAIQIFRGILKGMYYLHSKGIIHGDLKVSNVMIENSWEELPNNVDLTTGTTSNDCSLSLSCASTPPKGEIITPIESPWSPKPLPVSPDELKKEETIDNSSNKRFEAVDKNDDHFYRQKIVGILERNENRVRIIDFGVSYNSFKGDSSIFGTPMSMPPEVYNSSIIKSTQAAIKKRFGKQVSSSIVNAAFNFGMARDIWSLGVLLYTMITGEPPFIGENIKKLSEVILFKEPDFNNSHIKYEYALKDLLRRMLEKNPLKRITLKEIITHEWVTIDGFYPLTGIESPPLELKAQSINSATGKSQYSTLERKDTSQRLQAIINTRAKKAHKESNEFYPRSNSLLDLHLMDTDSMTPEMNERYSSEVSGTFLDEDSTSLTRQTSNPTLCYHRRGASTLSHDCSICYDVSPSRSPKNNSRSSSIFNSSENARVSHSPALHAKPRNASIDLSMSLSAQVSTQPPSKVVTHSASPILSACHPPCIVEKPPLPTRDEYDYHYNPQSPCHSTFRCIDMNDLSGNDSDNESLSPHVLIGRGAVSSHYQSIHIPRQPSISETSIEIPDRYVKKLDNTRISGSIPPLSEGLSASIQHLLRNSSSKRADTESTEPEGISTEEDFSKEFKKYEIISSPAFIDKHFAQSPESDESDYGEMDECIDILTDLDNYSSSTLDTELAKEFEPLEKGVNPVTVVHGNMVCSDMRIVCAFDSDKNGRDTMEDRISLLLSTKGIVPETSNHMNASIFCLFDGHGGNDCVDFINNRFISTLISQASFTEDIVTAVVNTYSELDKSFLEVAEKNNFFSGCTSNTIILINTKYEKTIYCANCGDSRAILCRNGTSIELNICHNTANTNEVKRILEAGGRIFNNRIMGVMQVTRSLGDIEYKTMKEYYWKMDFKDNLITSIPDICIEHRMRDDEFIIMASDGVFDVIPPQACVNFVRRQLLINNDLDLCSQELLKRAKRLGSPDNISVIIIYLNSGKPVI